MKTDRPGDFLNVRLSSEAVLAGLKSVRVSNAHFHYEFTAETTTRVLTSEWSRVLSKEAHVFGMPILEVAEGEE
jgi:hypothetical protein